MLGRSFFSMLPASAKNPSKRCTVAWTIPWNLIGTWVSGDVGGLTIYTDRFGRKVAFAKAPPDKPPTQNQIDQRERFRLAQASWSALSDAEKKSLEDVVKATSLCLTGQNLWIHGRLKDGQRLFDTLTSQTGISLPAL